jgi:transcriptional regulator with XRE-family HTH domain
LQFWTLKVLSAEPDEVDEANRAEAIADTLLPSVKWITIYLGLSLYVALLLRSSAYRLGDPKIPLPDDRVEQMAKVAQRTVGTTASGTPPMMARHNQQVEVPLRGQRRAEVRVAQASTVAPLRGDFGNPPISDQSASSRAQAQEVDYHVGVRIRDRRILLGLTQQQMAELIGVTYQQAHKYEKGINRVSAGRLYTMARAFGVQVSYFFEGLLDEGSPPPSGSQRLLLELARNFVGIRDRRHQEAVISVARALADANDGKQLPAA